MMQIYPNIDQTRLQKWHTDFMQNHYSELEAMTEKTFEYWKKVDAQSRRGYPEDVVQLNERMLSIYRRLNAVSTASQERWLGQIIPLINIYQSYKNDGSTDEPQNSPQTPTANQKLKPPADGFEVLDNGPQKPNNGSQTPNSGSQKPNNGSQTPNSEPERPHPTVRNPEEISAPQKVLNELTRIEYDIYQEAAQTLDDPGALVMRMFTLPVSATRWISADELKPVMELEDKFALFTNNPTVEKAESYFYRAIELQLEIQERMADGLDFYFAQQSTLWEAADAEVNRLIAEAETRKDPLIRLRLLGNQMFTNHRNSETDRILLAFIDQVRWKSGLNEKINRWVVEAAKVTNAEQRTGPTSLASLLNAPIAPDNTYVDHLWDAFVALLKNLNVLSQDAYKGARQHDKLLAALEGMELAVVDLIPLVNLVGAYIPTPHLPENVHVGIDLSTMVISEFLPGGSISTALNEVGKGVSILMKGVKTAEEALAPEVRLLSKIRSEVKATEHIPMSEYKVTPKNPQELKPVNGYHDIYIDNEGSYYLYHEGQYHEVTYDPYQERFELIDGNNLFHPHFAMEQGAGGRWKFHPMLGDEVLTQGKRVASEVSLPEGYKVFPEGLLSEEEGTGILFDEQGRNYINKSGDYYPVHFDAENDTWRVYAIEGENTKYRYPVFLDEEGVWQTHTDVGLKGGGPKYKLTAEERQKVVDVLQKQIRDTGKVNFAAAARELLHLRNNQGVDVSVIAKVAQEENITTSFRISEEVKEKVRAMLREGKIQVDIVNKLKDEGITMSVKSLTKMKRELLGESSIQKRRKFPPLTEPQIKRLRELNTEQMSMRKMSEKMEQEFPGLQLDRNRVFTELRKIGGKKTIRPGVDVLSQCPPELQQRIVELFKTKGSFQIMLELRREGYNIGQGAIVTILRHHGVYTADAMRYLTLSQEVTDSVIAKLRSLQSQGKPIDIRPITRELVREGVLVSNFSVRKIAIKYKIIPGTVVDAESVVKVAERVAASNPLDYEHVVSECAKQGVETTEIGASRMAVRLGVSSGVSLVTRAQAERIFDLAETGLKAQEIADRMKMHLRKVAETLNHYNTQTGMRAWWDAAPATRTGILKELEEGKLTGAAIAKKFNVKTETVRGIANQHIWARNKLIAKLLAEGKSPGEIAKKLKMAPEVVVKVGRKMPPSTHDIHLTAAEREETWKLLCQRGKRAPTTEEIAQKMGLSEWMVEKILQEESDRIVNALPQDKVYKAVNMLNSSDPLWDPEEISEALKLTEEEMGAIERENIAGNIVVPPPSPLPSPRPFATIIPVLEGDMYTEALRLLGEGKSAKEVAGELNVPVHSVERIFEHLTEFSLLDLMDAEVPAFPEIPGVEEPVQPGPSMDPQQPSTSGEQKRPASPAGSEGSSTSTPASPSTEQRPPSPEEPSHVDILSMPEDVQNSMIAMYKQGVYLSTIAQEFGVDIELLRDFLGIKLRRDYIPESIFE